MTPTGGNRHDRSLTSAIFTMAEIEDAIVELDRKMVALAAERDDLLRQLAECRDGCRCRGCGAAQGDLVQPPLDRGRNAKRRKPKHREPAMIKIVLWEDGRRSPTCHVCQQKFAALVAERVAECGPLRPMAEAQQP